MNFKDYIIPLAWPESLTKTANGPYDKLLTTFNIHKQGYYKTGHAAFLLIEGITGKIEYFDFGRYISPFKNGRIRSAETDPELIIHQKAIIQNKQIINLKEILEQISINQETHGSGNLYASVLSTVNYNLALQYIQKKQNIPFIPYGPFHIGGTNCSRFVAQTINKSIKKGGFKFLFPIYGTPSPLGNVFNTDSYDYYKIANGKIEQLRKPNRLSQLNLIRSKLLFNSQDRIPIPAKEIIKLESIPKNAQWLNGTGAGAWYTMESQINNKFKITRFQVNGKKDFELTYTPQSTSFQLEDQYHFTYPSHAKEVNIIQNGKTHLFTRVYN